MLSVVIATDADERALPPTLGALVAGVVAGMVREVIIADRRSRDATAAIADAAGCRLLSLSTERAARLRAGADAARGEWLLFLRPGVLPDSSWVEETRRFVQACEVTGQAAQRAAVFRVEAAGPRPPLREPLNLLRSALRYRSIGGHALVIAKPLYRRIGGHRDVDEPETDLLRRLGRRRIARLRTGVIVLSAD
ncbi:MAG TPA: glycosyltransferase [Xanthobacteraceae bacterium]